MKPFKTLFVFICSLLILSSLFIFQACTTREERLNDIDYSPEELNDWETSTPEDVGLDPLDLAEMYYNATQLESLYGLLVIKDGVLVAEDYFNDATLDERTHVQSVTKSFISALIGICIQKGYIESVDQKMMDFFPEFVDDIEDTLKFDISIKHLLQMRAGYPWEESTPELFQLLLTGFHSSDLVNVALTAEPGMRMEYSNLTSHILGMIISKATGTDLKSFAEEMLFEPLDIQVDDWIQDWDGNYLGYCCLQLRARDMAKFGQMYLDGGVWADSSIVPSDWVSESLDIYSENAWKYRVGKNFKDICYGYQWWSIRSGDHRYHLAWGHGGQQIAILDDLNMIIVAKADPLFGAHGDYPWRLEKANLNLVANYIKTLP